MVFFREELSVLLLFVHKVNTRLTALLSRTHSAVGIALSPFSYVRESGLLYGQSSSKDEEVTQEICSDLSI